MSTQRDGGLDRFVPNVSEMQMRKKGGKGMTRPKIGLALSSGGARGFAHLGVLKVLKEEGIPVDCVAGSSMGSIMAVLLANGLDLDMCEKLLVL